MRDMISVESNFQYSVNIAYDIGNDDKLKNFIPTKSAISLLEDILCSTNIDSTDRARILIGAYGKGKSHVVLTILSMLMRRDISLFEKLLPKIKENEKLYRLVLNYYEGENKILPVVVSGSNTNLTQAFLISLQRTLSKYDLLNVMPETNYTAAIRTIQRWEKSFPDTYEMFKQSISVPVELFKEQLSDYNIDTYVEFEKIYPSLTAGSIFNPFLDFDVVEIYESVAKGLKIKGYTGIYVVYDEFSKYLEANIKDASVSDTKMLQDFAEKCCRSGSLQLHLMLISHKEISNYIDKLPKEKTDGWRGVSERFKHIHMNNNFSQTYEIISSIIQHKGPNWDIFCNKHENDFASLFARYENHRMFLDARDEIETAIKGCFPLHPVSTFILPRLSERIAQNERTLFTFLSAKGTATLDNFLETYEDDFSLVTPDLIYDYFEPLLRKEVYAGDIHDMFVLTSTILNQLPSESLGSKIIKTLSLIYILEQFERLSPTKEQIIGIYSSTYEVDEIERTINELIEKEFVIYLKRSNNFLRLKQTSGVDIKQKIHDMLESQNGVVTEREILNASNFDNYMYPVRYNDEHEMTRFFIFQFISASEIDDDVNWDIKGENVSADGIIYGVIPDDKEQLDQAKKKIAEVSKGFEQGIFVLPKQFREIKGIAYEYDVVEKLRDQASDDPVLFDEYEVIFEDLQEVIRGYIETYTRPENHGSIYIHNGRRLDIQRRSGLTEVMSQICDKVFSMTPTVNNESVNKNDITSVALNSRGKIISALLRSELETNLGLSGTGQDVSIMRSTLIRTGIWEETEGRPQLNIHPTDPKMGNLLKTIESFFMESKEKSLGFDVLYERITSPKHHIGLRAGLIPIYIAVVMHNYRQQVVVNSKSGPVPLNADLLIQINKTPKNYTLDFLDWTSEKEEYVEKIGEAFSRYVVDVERLGNSYDYVANAMHRWYMSLPKYSKECKTTPYGEKLSHSQLDMIRLLKQNVNGSELLFKKLPDAFGCGEDYLETERKIIETKETFDNLLTELREYMINKTKEMLLLKCNKQGNNGISLWGATKEWCDHLDDKSFEQLFPDGTERFLQYLRKATADEEMLISGLAKIATGLRMEDWDAKTIDLYVAMVSQFIQTAEKFHSEAVAETINETTGYQITFAEENGQSQTRRFDKVDITARGKLLFNQITASLDAMGHAISEQEKRQVLMEILKKLC